MSQGKMVAFPEMCVHDDDWPFSKVIINGLLLLSESLNTREGGKGKIENVFNQEFINLSTARISKPLKTHDHFNSLIMAFFHHIFCLFNIGGGTNIKETEL